MRKNIKVLIIFITMFFLNLLVVSAAKPNKADCDITITKNKKENIRLDWNCSEGEIKNFILYSASDDTKQNIGCFGYACSTTQSEKGAWELDKKYFTEDESYYIRFETNSKNKAFKYIVSKEFKINSMNVGEKKDAETGKIKSKSDSSGGETTNWRSDAEKDSNEEQIRQSCTDFKELIEKYWSWVVLLAPIGLMVLITLDFLKATATGDSDAISKSSTNAIKRTIATLVLLLLPLLLSTIFGMFGLGVCI